MIYDPQRSDHLNRLYENIASAQRKYPDEGLMVLEGSDEPERDAYWRDTFRESWRYVDSANHIDMKRREGGASPRRPQIDRYEYRKVA